MKKKIYVTRRLPQKAMDLLAEKFQMEFNPEEKALSKKEVIERTKDCEGLLSLLTEEIDQDVFQGCPHLKIVSNYAVGFNNINVPQATARGILVTNTPGVLTETTADMAFTLLMAISRRVVESDQYLRQGKFKGWGPLMFLGQDIHNSTLGILGMGRIGYALALRGCRGFNMKIIYYDIYGNEGAEKNLGARRCSTPEELFQEADFISIHLDLNAETHHFVNEKRLRLMKPSASIINTARGPIIDEAALAKVLKEGKIFGAALDVFEEEPKIHPDLIELSNTILVPHIASASVETRTKMALMAAENLIAGLEGRVPPCLVNPEVLKGKDKS